MNTNVTKVVDWNKLVRLFTPGSGVTPPLLAGREAPLQKLADLAGYLREDGKAAPAEAVLHGPRGNGKTVLLDAFTRQCKGVEVISLTPGDIKDQTDLAAHLLYDDNLFGQFLEATRSRAGADLGLGFATVTWDSLGQAERDNFKRRHLVDLLLARCRKRALLVNIDEAHTLETEVGRTLLNASQRVRREGAPFLLALAGTPNLRERLDRMDATFWDRAEIISVGRLDAAATRAALAKPLNASGVSFEDDALDQVVAESQRYPYFIQAWGQALCLELRERETTRMDAALVDAARPAFSRRRIDYYEKRCEELEDKDLLPAARTVASMFQRTDSMDSGALKQALAADLSLDTKGALAVVRQLTHLGFIWKPSARACYEPGIPSLMDYVLTV